MSNGAKVRDATGRSGYDARHGLFNGVFRKTNDTGVGPDPSFRNPFDAL